MKNNIIRNYRGAGISARAIVAQQSRTQKIINAALKGWNIELRAGYNLGGTSPIPLPVEIREIKSYKHRWVLCGVGLH